MLCLCLWCAVWISIGVAPIRGGPCGPVFWPKASPLERHRLSPAYRCVLQRGMKAFRMWCSVSQVTVAPDISAACLDVTLLAFIHLCLTTKLPFYVARAAVLYAQLVLPRVRWHLPRAWNALKGWKKALPSRARTPLPFELLQYLFLFALDLAVRADSAVERRVWLTMAVLLRIGFFGLMRPRELVSLRRKDLRFVEKFGAETALLAAIKEPKTAQVESAGVHQFVTIRDPGTVAWAASLTRDMDADARLWMGSQDSFARTLRVLLSQSLLAGLRLTPACLRAGGTTYLFISGFTLEQISFLGRWTTLGTLRSYIQESAA